jgi:hypothetical protein
METTSPATLLQRVSSPGYASKVSEVALRLTQATEPSLMQSLMCEGTRALGTSCWPVNPNGVGSTWPPV